MCRLFSDKHHDRPALPFHRIRRRTAADGWRLLALTDHDNTGGLAQARQAAESSGMRLVSGAELSVSWRTRTIHIVGLDFDEGDGTLQALMRRVRQGRLERLAQIAEKLAKQGISGAYEGALALAANPEMVSRTHIADFLVHAGHVRRKQQAFDKYLGDGKCASVPHRWGSLDETVSAVLGAGGIAVIAHPMRYGLSATARRNLFQEFKNAGGRAIEIHSGRTEMNERRNYALMAQRFGFLASAGSDFHREGDYHGGALGVCPPLPECEPVWRHFRQPFSD